MSYTYAIFLSVPVLVTSWSLNVAERTMIDRPVRGVSSFFPMATHLLEDLTFIHRPQPSVPALLIYTVYSYSPFLRQNRQMPPTASL